MSNSKIIDTGTLRLRIFNERLSLYIKVERTKYIQYIQDINN